MHFTHINVKLMSVNGPSEEAESVPKERELLDPFLMPRPGVSEDGCDPDFEDELRRFMWGREWDWRTI